MNLFNQAISDTSIEIKFLNAFGGEGENNPNYPREFLKGKVETQAHTIRILASYESDRFI